MSEYRLRPAAEADAEAICRIYNQGIEDRLATLETELRTAEERRQWLARRGPRHPIIVAEATQPHTAWSRPPTDQGGLAAPATTITGWGSLNVFNPREAYR
ncbi:MAG: GNAT family N-acetyltransferase, partial [Candidatus Rokuibacteriota bacterium]